MMESIGIYALIRNEITTATMDGVRAIGYRARHISPKVFSQVDDVEPFRAVILGDLSPRQSDIVSAYANVSGVRGLAKRQSIPIMAVIPAAQETASDDSWVVFMPTATGLLEDRTTISCSMDAIKKGVPFKTILQRYTAHEMGLAIEEPGKVKQPPRGAEMAEADTSDAIAPPETMNIRTDPPCAEPALEAVAPEPVAVLDLPVAPITRPKPSAKRGRPFGSKNVKPRSKT